MFEDFTGYKNRHGAIWGRGKVHLFKNLKLADNAIGFTHAAGALNSNAYSSRVVDSIFVGESDNLGNPSTPTEVAYGRSMPQETADFPIRGYEYYDYIQQLENVSFVNFQDNDTRKAGAISYLLYTSFGISTENTVADLAFDNAKPVYFPPEERKWASDFASRAGFKGAVFHDTDGSVGGVPGAYVVIDNGIASDEDACEIKPDWGAAVCRGDFGRMSVGGGGGAVPGGPANRPAPAPVTLSRNGRQMELGGETTIRSGAEVTVDTARDEVQLSLREMEKGSWVIFEMPGFSTPAEGTRLDSLDALRNAGATSYYQGDDALWVKLVVNETSGAGYGPMAPRTSIEVRR